MDPEKLRRSVHTFQTVIDGVESGDVGEEVLRKLIEEVARQAPVSDVLLMAEVVLKSQRAAVEQNIRHQQRGDESCE